MIVLKQKDWGEYIVIIKWRQEDDGFQVQIEAKASFPSAGPHIRYMEAGL